jgi:hypothetical protein
MVLVEEGRYSLHKNKYKHKPIVEQSAIHKKDSFNGMASRGKEVLKGFHSGQENLRKAFPGLADGSFTRMVEGRPVKKRRR